MIALTEMVVELEEQETQLNILEEYQKAIEEDPIFMDLIIMGTFKALAEQSKTIKKNSTQLYIKYEEACKVVQEALIGYRYLLNVQVEMNELKKGYEQDLKGETKDEGKDIS